MGDNKTQKQNCTKKKRNSSRRFFHVRRMTALTKVFIRRYHTAGGMDLKLIVQKLESFAPKSLAGSWDNVGLLIEPSGEKVVSKIILTNDLTEPVMDESLQVKADM